MDFGEMLKKLWNNFVNGAQTGLSKSQGYYEEGMSMSDSQLCKAYDWSRKTGDTLKKMGYSKAMRERGLTLDD